MKKKYIYSCLLGGSFFAIPYLALGVNAIPAAAIGIVAYGAGTLIFKEKETIDISSDNENLYEVLKKAKDMNYKLEQLIKQLEDKNIIQNVKEICTISNKIIDTISKKPEKLKKAKNFLNYYLPITIKILTRYDEIENQHLNTEESKKFMNSVEEMMCKIKNAFNEQLSNIYQTEMVDTDAELKVFESMLKSDGFLNEVDFNIDDKK